MIFSDKYIDYSSKTRKELRQALILFSLLSNRLIVKIGNYLLKITLKLHLPVLFIIKKTIFKHFCGGENISESRKKINDLGAHNIQTILDYSVEGKNDVKSLENTYKEILRNLDEANKNSLIPFSVFKFTGLARFDLLKKINQK
ncbi:MAG: proline dehydrogenase, partial [Flavobacteriales bacterium]|nr:proline dehydrogenase [Flavobacteriales bacterium]